MTPEGRSTSPRRPQQKRARETRAALLRAATAAFSQDGYAATTTAGIAGRAGVATGTLYQYFRDKDALLQEIARERAGLIESLSLVELMAQDAAVRGSVSASRSERVASQMRAIVGIVMAHHRDDPGLHAVLTERRHCDPELDAITTTSERALVARIAELLERWGHRGDVEATAFVLFGLVEGAIHAHVLGTRVVSDERFVSALVEALIRVASPPA
ncbi:MAG: TetR/AcrR family transcriptional regulator [Polyangiaceae bacterium]